MMAACVEEGLPMWEGTVVPILIAESSAIMMSSHQASAESRLLDWKTHLGREKFSFRPHAVHRPLANV